MPLYPIVQNPLIWEKILDESGASISNWTNVAGTWAADAGGYIKQTSTATAYSMLRYTAALPSVGKIAMQADIRMPSSGQPAGVHRALLEVAGQGIASASNSRWGGVQDGNGSTDQAMWQRGDQATGGAVMTINTDQWYNVLLICCGRDLLVSVDGVSRLSIQMSAVDISSIYYGLVTYQGIVHYKNIKAWRDISVPA